MKKTYLEALEKWTGMQAETVGKDEICSLLGMDRNAIDYLVKGGADYLKPEQVDRLALIDDLPAIYDVIHPSPPRAYSDDEIEDIPLPV